MDLDDWLTVHHSITLVNFQLDAQNSYLLPFSAFSTGAQDSHLQRVTIPEAAYIQLQCRSEDEQGNARNM